MSLWPGEQYEPLLQFAIELGKEVGMMARVGGDLAIRLIPFLFHPQ
jgi:hypothetical protein